ncbi:hypothetical protein [Bradyrhizobium sp. JR3.5]
MLISIKIAPPSGRILATLDSFRLLTQGGDSKSSGQMFFHVFRRLVQNQPRSNLVYLVRVARDEWLRGTEFHYLERPERTCRQ